MSKKPAKAAPAPAGVKGRLARLPRGLQTFENSLFDLEFAEELVKRLQSLPRAGAGFDQDLVMLKNLLGHVQVAEEAAKSARNMARGAALLAWKKARRGWTVKQLQKATGYTDD